MSQQTGYSIEEFQRIQAALAEAGHDPDLIVLMDDGRVGGSFFLPIEVGWRAREIAAAGPIRCLACVKEASQKPIDEMDAIQLRCEAFQRLTEDCGVER